MAAKNKKCYTPICDYQRKKDLMTLILFFSKKIRKREIAGRESSIL